MAVFMTAWLFYASLWILKSPILANCDGEPKFRGEPQRMYVAYLGNSVKLKCPVTGTDNPFPNKTLVAWFKGANVIHNTHSNWSRFLIRKDKHLKIVNVKEGDAGTYKCRGQNQYGLVELIIRLKVEPTRKPGRGKPPRFKAFPKKKNTYKTGETAKLHCHSTGDPDPIVEWFKDGKSYGVERRTSVAADGWTLNLRYLSVADTGHYTCRVSNNVGSINRTFTVVVKARVFKPVIEEPEASMQTARQGRSVKFDCKVTSVGQVQFTWKWFDKVAHTSVDLKTTKKFGSKYIGNYTKTRVVSMNRFYFDGFLVVKDVTKEDEGKYTCIVKSSHGTDEMDFYLHVRGKGKDKNIDQQGSTTSRPSRLGEHNTGGRKGKARTEDSETDIPVALVAVLSTAIIVALIFIAILTLYCRNQRKNLEKQYVNEYQPQSMFQPYSQQMSVYQEMQKYDQNDSENGNSTESVPVTTEVLISSQSSQDSLGPREDSKRTSSTSREMYLAKSQTSLHTTLCRPYPQQSLIDYKWDVHHSILRRTESANGLQSSGMLPRRVSSSGVSTVDYETERKNREGQFSLDRSPKNTNPQRSRESIV